MPQLVESCGIFFFCFILYCLCFSLPLQKIKIVIMRVLIVNTSERAGGAAVAANRLMDALNNNGVKAKMLVRDKVSDDITVVGVQRSLRSQWNFLWERWCIFWHLHFSRKNLFGLDIANIGFDITSLPEFKEADVIHLHWINQGMLSLKNIRKIINSGKPVVWTMHDMWPASSICHLTLGCHHYTNGCGNCKYLPGGGRKNDLSAKVWRQKQKTYGIGNISFVTCSKWLASEAKLSALLNGQRVYTIPNPIDTHVYQQQDKREARFRTMLPEGKRVILFIAQKATNPYKGMDYLVEACQLLVSEHPEMKDNTCVAILGGHSEEIEGQLPFPTFPLGYVSDDKHIVDIYNSADVFVLPSLSENLPNTIMEAMACGVPSVGFRVGGIPEMIDHKKNGYVANYRDAKDLAVGIHWVLDEADQSALQQSCLAKVMHNYSQHAVALNYIEIYNEAMAYKHYRI